MQENDHRPCIAIVGGSGFVGSSLTRHLSTLYRVRVLDLKPPRNHGTDFRACDIRRRDDLARNFRGCHLVINTAVVQVPEINSHKRLGYEVNVLGLQNICEAAESTASVRGVIHTGSWHVFGERDLHGVLDEQFGFRPDMIEDRRRLYALCKIAQESVIRIIAETSNKSYSVMRLGTVLGEGMPKQTAANLFIDNALSGKPITPFKHTQHRPMLYVDIQDVCRGFESLTAETLDRKVQHGSPLLVNLLSPYPLTIIELARIIRKEVVDITGSLRRPKIEVIDMGMKSAYRPRDKSSLRVDISKARHLLGSKELTHPRQTIKRIIAHRAKGSA